MRSVGSRAGGTYAIWNDSRCHFICQSEAARGPTRVPLTALKCILVGSFKNEVCIVLYLLEAAEREYVCPEDDMRMVSSGKLE